MKTTELIIKQLNLTEKRRRKRLDRRYMVCMLLTLITVTKNNYTNIRSFIVLLGLICASSSSPRQLRESQSSKDAGVARRQF